MNRCPITYETCEKQRYSQKGIRQLSKSLKELHDFPYSAKEQIQKAAELASKLSIQGVQPKLNVIFNARSKSFEIVEAGGRYIIKPPHHLYEEVPQNEDFTMRLAHQFNIETPLHGMIYNIDGSLSYFIKRFDRERNQKIAIEDFSQLLQCSRETKYDSSMEKVASVLEKHCTFPLLEKIKLFRLVIFNFLTGNEDMHLKNFSLIRRDDKVELSPAYDLLNTTILLKAKEEIALPIKGKKSKLTREDFVEYFAIERLGLPESVVNEVMQTFETFEADSLILLNQSFLSEQMRERYRLLIEERYKRLKL